MLKVRLVGALLLAVASLALLARGFTVISDDVLLRNVNGFSTAIQRLSGECRLPGVYPFTIKVNSTSRRANITCPLATQVFSRTIQTYIPKSSALTKSTFCQSQNVWNFNTTLIPKPDFTAPGQLERAFRRYNRTALLLANETVDSFWEALASVGTTIGCGFAYVSTSGISQAVSDATGGWCSPGNNGISVDEFAAYARSQASLWQNQQDFNSNITSWIDSANDQFNFIQRQQMAVRAYQEANSRAVSSLTRAFRNVQPQIDIIVSETTKEFRRLQDQANQQTANQLQFVNIMEQNAAATASAINITLARLSQYQATTNEVQNAMGQTIYDNFIDTYQKFLSTQQSITQLAAAVQNIITRAQSQVPLTRMFQEQVAAVDRLNLATGRQYVFFLENLGLPGRDPYNLPSRLISKPIEVIQFKYIAQNPEPATDNPLAVFSQLKYVCGGLYLALNQNPAQSWTQLVNTLGPRGCNNTEAAQGPNFCNCWIEIFEEACQMPSSASCGGAPKCPPSDASVLNYNANPNPTLIPFGTSGTYCSSPQNPLTSVLPNNTIKSVEDLLVYSRELCRRTLWAASNGYVAYSAFFSKQYRAPYVNCTEMESLSEFMNPTKGPYNVMFTIINFFLQALGSAATSIAYDSAEILGTMPTNMTYIDSPFNTFGFGVTGPCMDAFAAVHDMTTMLAIYRWELVRTDQNVHLDVEGEPRRTFSQGTLSNPYSLTLGKLNGAYVASEQSTDLISNVFNAPFGAMTPGSNAIANEGGYPYTSFRPLRNGAVIPFNERNLTTWSLQNPLITYNHQAGFASADQVECTLTFPTGRLGPVCEMCGPAPQGELCGIMDNYDLVKQGLEVRVSSVYNVLEVQIDIPVGVLESIAGSACPVVTPSYQNNTALTLSLFNSLALPNEIEIVQTGGCPSVQTVSLQPQEVYPLTVPYCSNTPPGETEQITFNYNPGLGYFSPCNATYNVTISPTRPYQSVAAAPSYVHTEARLTVAADQTFEMTQQVMTASINMQLSLVIGLMRVFELNKIIVSNVTDDPLGAFGPVFKLIKELGQNITNQANNRKNYVFSYPDELKNFSLALEENLKESEYFQKVAENATAVLSDLIGQSAVNLATLAQKTNDIANTLERNRVGIEYSNALTDAIIAGARNRINAGGLGGILGLFNILAGLPGTLLDKGSDLFKAVVNGPLDALAGALGGAASGIAVLIIIIVVGLAICAVVGLVVYYFVKQKPAKDAADAEIAHMVEFLQNQGYKPLKDTQAAQKATGGMRRRHGRRSKKADAREEEESDELILDNP